jgi:hypothetical protein
MCRFVDVLFNFLGDRFKEFFVGLGEEMGFFFCKCKSIPSHVII